MPTASRSKVISIAQVAFVNVEVHTVYLSV